GCDPMAVRWQPGTGLIPGGAFDFDHRCAKVAKQHRAVRTGEHPREVGDQQAIKRAWSVVGSPGVLLVVLLRHRVHASSRVLASGRHEQRATTWVSKRLRAMCLSVRRTNVR